MTRYSVCYIDHNGFEHWVRVKAGSEQRAIVAARRKTGCKRSDIIDVQLY